MSPSAPTSPTVTLSDAPLAPLAERMAQLTARLTVRLASSDPAEASRFLAELEGALQPFLAGADLSSLETLHLMLAATAVGLYEHRREVLVV